MAKRTVLRKYRPHVAVKDRYVCVYCGEPAECIDHVLPIRYSNWKPEITGYAEQSQLVTVPACAECNGAARDKAFQTFTAKREYIRGRLRKRHAKLLASPEWDDTELAGLTGRLQEYVRGQQLKRQRLKDRLQYRGLTHRL